MWDSCAVPLRLPLVDQLTSYLPAALPCRAWQPTNVAFIPSSPKDICKGPCGRGGKKQTNEVIDASGTESRDNNRL